MIIGGREHAVGLCGGCEESKDIIAEESCKPLYGENNPYFKLFVKYGGGLPWICKKADYKKEKNNG
jgi:hypothetical protein